MCLTNPDVEPYQRYSMIIVPTRTPGVNILRDVPDHGRARPPHGRARRPRRDPLRGRAGAATRTSSATRATASCWPRSGSARAASTTPCAGWASPAGLRHAVRAGAVPLHARLAPGREADDPGLDRRELRRDAGGPAADAAGGVEDGPAARGRPAPQRRPGRDRDDQVLGRQGALQRDRPGHPGPRLARLHHRPAARVDVPRRPGGPHLRRPRRGPQGHRGPPGPEAVQGRPRCRASTCPTRRKAAQEKFAEYLDGISLNS